MITYRELALSEARVESLTDEEIVHLLQGAGASRLTAERIVAIERDGGEASRARRHTRGG